MVEILTVILVIAAVGLIGLVLIQHGKGADMGASFGAGASATVFGSTGSGNFLTRTTAILAAVFFICALGLSHLASRKEKSEDSLLQGPAAPAAQELPVQAKPAPASDIPADVKTQAPAAEPVKPAPVEPKSEASEKNSEMKANAEKKADNTEKK
ncbi:MAG: preprotein translocase subunit SecG [Gammaproteobacteria bacterium]|nr:preprotein translocase subunit SecG [Gammaproteobacteria bacterium]